MKKLYNKFIVWLFMTGSKPDAIDRDNDGLVQEGTPYERKVTTVATPKKKAPAKKAPAKKAPVKKTVKKTTKKK